MAAAPTTPEFVKRVPKSAVSLVVVDDRRVVVRGGRIAVEKLVTDHGRRKRRRIVEYFMV
jgi:hypothetical protein